jgi:threonyl-tRNA synthetase
MKNKNDLRTMRHSCEHVLTQAMMNLWPEKIVMAMGPATNDGFYFDFEQKGNLKISVDDFGKIEKEMKRIIKSNLPIVKKEIAVKEAKEIFADNPYKLEWLNEIENKGQKAVVYKTGNDFIDLCAGPHLKSTGEIGAFKLLSIAGAYWHGSEKNKMLTRIYGTCFSSQKELDEYLNLIEEAKKRDHRKIGKELDYFSQNEQLGAGLILWHPKLSLVREEIELWWRKEHRKKGYQYVYTPHIGKKALWDISGHTGFYKDLMYPPLKDKKGDVYFLKPMNCNGHILIYKSKTRSYKDLPLKYCELGTVYRYELEGVRHGILRPRGFTQDDAHIICTKDQIVKEVENSLDFALEMNRVFGFDDLHYEISTRDPENLGKYAGNEKDWQLAEKTMIDILKSRKVEFSQDPGGAKFYGPSIDLKAEDSLGRLWQGTTIQFDFNLPGKFEMTYTGPEGKQEVPIMIHRTLLGSMERFVGVLIEQFAGAFPVWLSPIQATIMPITKQQSPWARKIAKKLNSSDIRVEINDSNQTLSNRIRQAEEEKIPFIIIVGEKEEKEKLITVRQRGGQEFRNIDPDEYASKVKKIIETKSLKLISNLKTN